MKQPISFRLNVIILEIYERSVRPAQSRNCEDEREVGLSLRSFLLLIITAAAMPERMITTKYKKADIPRVSAFSNSAGKSCPESRDRIIEKLNQRADTKSNHQCPDSNRTADKKSNNQDKYF